MSRLFVNALTVIDASLLDPELGLVGESWLVDIELEGSLNDQGMVLDFGVVKRQVKQTIDREFDHKLLVPVRAQGCSITPLADGRVGIRFTTTNGATVLHESPGDAVARIGTARIDLPSLTHAIGERLRPTLPANVRGLEIRLRHEAEDAPFFRYSHGLKYHDGNCQRIAHGHRSRIEIRRDGVRDEGLELGWVERWRDCYIGTEADLLGNTERGGTKYLRFGYRADQGRFELELPADRCYLISTDSTVENLAQHVAETLKREHPGSSFRTRVCEGVEKGAIGEA